MNENARASVTRPHGPFSPFLLAALILGAAGSGCADTTSVIDPSGNGGGGGAAPYDHDLAPGASAADLLASAEYDRLVVQIHYVDGYAPSATGLQALENFLSARLNKPGGITLLVPQQIEIAQQPTYSAAEIRALEDTHRTVYTEGRTLAAYLLFLDGELEGGPTVLGLAYHNTSMALFQEKIVTNTGGPLEPPQWTVEAAVANHEFGHIMGLVDLGSDMQVEHRDEPHGHHCDDPDCLMYYAVRTTDFLANLTGGDVPDLDQDCLDDLRANGGK